MRITAKPRRLCRPKIPANAPPTTAEYTLTASNVIVFFLILSAAKNSVRVSSSSNALFPLCFGRYVVVSVVALFAGLVLRAFARFRAAFVAADGI